MLNGWDDLKRQNQTRTPNQPPFSKLNNRKKRKWRLSLISVSYFLALEACLIFSLDILGYEFGKGVEIFKVMLKVLIKLI